MKLCYKCQIYYEVISLNISKEEYILNLLNEIKKIDYIKTEDIPNIELYMDQVTTYMDKHLKSSIKDREKEDKMLTKTMINNYTKNDLLPPPIKKKYTKEHMLLLIFIYYMKNILTITDIQNLLNPLTEEYFHAEDGINLEDIYTEVFNLEKEQIDSLTEDVMKKYTRSKTTFEQAPEKDREFLTTFSLICMLGFDVYMKKAIIEKLIDSAYVKKSSKSSSDKPKKKEKEKEE